MLLLEPVFRSKQTRVILFVFHAAGKFSAQTKAVCGTGARIPQFLSSALAAGIETCSPVPIPFKFPMAGGRSVGDNSHLPRVSGFSLGGIWETGERF